MVPGVGGASTAATIMSGSASSTDGPMGACIMPSKVALTMSAFGSTTRALPPAISPNKPFARAVWSKTWWDRNSSSPASKLSVTSKLGIRSRRAEANPFVADARPGPLVEKARPGACASLPATPAIIVAASSRAVITVCMPELCAACRRSRLTPPPGTPKANLVPRLARSLASQSTNLFEPLVMSRNSVLQ